MENYNLVTQWAASLKTDKAFNELNNLRTKYPWLKCDESFEFVSKMHNDLSKMLHIIVLQEKQNAVLRRENESLRNYIEVNRMADELLLDEIKAKYPLINI